LKRRLRGRRNQSVQFGERKSVACTGNQTKIPLFFGTTDHETGQYYNGLIIELTECNSSISQGISYMFRLKYTHRQAECENKKEEFTAPGM
jgi:hypothetical protein